MKARAVSVLIVEDNPGDARLIREYLKLSDKTAYAVEAVDTLADAVDRMAQRDFDVALLDLSLPDSQGIATLDAVLARRPDLAVIILTGLDDDELSVRALKKGAQDYLVKGRFDEKLISRAILYAMERKRNEEALKRSEQRYRIIFDGSRDAVFIVNPEGGTVDANQAALALTGYSLEELAARPVTDLFPPAHLPAFKANFRRVMAGAPLMVEGSILRKDGDEIDAEFSCTRFFMNGKAYMHAVVRDITAKIRMQKHSETLAEQLRQAQKLEAVGTLAGGVAHDFNNILGIIIGNAELAVDDTPEWSPARLNIEEIKIAGLRARDVVRQLLSFSRKTEQKRKVLNIESLVKESVKLLRASIPASVDIRLDAAPGLRSVLADPTQIHQVLINLCTNAAHAMAEKGGVLGIRLANTALESERTPEFPDMPPGDYVQLTMTDTGCGIPEDIREKIFDPYFTTKEVGKGSGMGLSVVLGVVKNHDGAIHVKSREDEGTRVEVLFPAVTDRPEARPPETGDPPGGAERILFIDDEPSMAMAGHQILERLGYKVTTRIDPNEGLRLFTANPDAFDLVITDYTMPGLNGDQLAGENLKLRPDAPVILCTGYSDRIDDRKAAALGIRKYLEKPLNKRDLALAVRHVLDNPAKKGDTPS